MGVCVLERLDQSQSFVDTATNRQVVHGDLSQYLLIVDDEEASQSVADIFQIDTIVARDCVRQIGKQRNVEFTQSTFYSRTVGPCKVSEV